MCFYSLIQLLNDDFWPLTSWEDQPCVVVSVSVAKQLSITVKKGPALVAVARELLEIVTTCERHFDRSASNGSGLMEFHLEEYEGSASRQHAPSHRLYHMSEPTSLRSPTHQHT